MVRSHKQKCLILLLLIAVVFYSGQIVGYIMHKMSKGIDCNISFQQPEELDSTIIDTSKLRERYIDSMVRAKVNKELELKEGNDNRKAKITSMALISKEEFLKEFDTGHTGTGISGNRNNDDVLMLHVDGDDSEIVTHLPKLSPLNATERCGTMHVIAMRTRTPKTCLAIFNNYDSYHLQRWMRIEGNGLNTNAPFQRVSRQTTTEASNEFPSPFFYYIKMQLSLLKTYLNSLDGVLANLTPIVKGIATNNTIVIMTCNYGQATLLVNFVCSSRARGIDIGNVLVFATDKHTLKVAQELGLTAFYDEEIFLSIPQEAAPSYGGRKFGDIMWAKVIVTHIISMLNYDFIFQDVDVIWYKNPLEYFHATSNEMLRKYDIFFHDDGNSALRFTPLRANSGFYYVRSNDKTRYLFTSLLYVSAYTLSGRSHQESLIALLMDHISLFALKVKILPPEEFSGGREFHMNPRFMRNIILKKTVPWIFHMCWTENKDNKILYFKQMGMWYLSDKYLIDTSEVKTLKYAPENCCSSEPLISCHYIDKPSVLSCKDSFGMKDQKESFW